MNGVPRCARGLAPLVLCLAVHTAAADELQVLLSDLERLRVELDIPALALTLADRDGTIWTGAMGVADRDSGRIADAATRFRIGSITKLFTALALQLAAQDGALNLERPLREVVPDPPLFNPWEHTHPVRLVHLLEHTAGLPDMDREEFDATQPLPLREALAWKAAERRVLWPPGQHHSYTNVGAGLAALALESATGQTYESFVRRRIFAPLGMASAGFFPDADTLANLATGYDADGVTVIPYWHMLYRAFGAISLRPADMSPLIQLLLNRGTHGGLRLLPATAILRMEQPRSTLAAQAGLHYGYGLGNYAWLHRGVLFHGHGGDGDGYLARLGYSNERGRGYFLAINVFRNADLARLQRRVEDFIAGDARIAEPPAPALPAQLLASFAGEYESVTDRFPRPADRPPASLRIEVEDGDLFLLRAGQRRRLIPVSAALFRFAGETVATSALVPCAERTCFQGDAGSFVQRGARPEKLDSAQ